MTIIRPCGHSADTLYRSYYKAPSKYITVEMVMTYRLPSGWTKSGALQPNMRQEG